MSTISLPENPSLENLRKQVRTLQRAVRAGEPAAITLVARHHPEAIAAGAATFPLSAAQLVVARAYGFASWPQLKHHLDVIQQYWWDPSPTAGPAAPADSFCRLACLTYADDDPRRWANAAALLAESPQLTANHIWAAAAADDVETVKQLLATDRGLATRPGGPYGWRPLCYLAYSRLNLNSPEGSVLAIATVLLEAGADPNEGYLWEGLATPFTLLTGVFGEGELGPRRQPAHPHSLALARLLLEAGADPNDGQALYNRMFEPANDHLEVLFEFGLGAGDGGPWKARLAGSLPTPAELLRGQLEWAASHGQLPRVRLLAEHGVDVRAPFDDGRTPAEVAAVSGHTGIVEYVLARGATAPAFDTVDALIAAAMAGDRAAVAAFGPTTIDQARRRRPGLIAWAAANGRHEAVRVLLELGFDVNALSRGDAPVEQRWQTALHEAASRGDRDLATLLLAAGADPHIVDARFHQDPLGWATWAGDAPMVDLLTEHTDSTHP